MDGSADKTVLGDARLLLLCLQPTRAVRFIVSNKQSKNRPTDRAELPGACHVSILAQAVDLGKHEPIQERLTSMGRV